MNRGFTLPEMLVVCTILVIMVTVVLANTRDLGINAKVKASQALIIDTLKDTRNKSVAVKQFNAAVFPSFGVHFDLISPQQVIVYADCVADNNGDEFVNQDDTFDYGNNDCGPGGNLDETIELEPNTKIKAIRAIYPVNGVMQTFNETKVDILFLRPEPTIWMYAPSAIGLATKGLIPTGRIEIDVSDLNDKLIRTDILYSSGEFTEK